MPKRSREKEEQRLWKNGQALLSEQSRVITENQELQNDLENLRKKYIINFRNIQDHNKWMSSQSLDTLLGFSKTVEKSKNKA